jgi:2-polyprenyl-3-methyl-5-hydroxy-6-metoxy-1,4-benzoquinol methylase
MSSDGRKQFEVDYPKKLDERGKQWLHDKPFSSYDREESQKNFHDFSTILFLLNQNAPKAKKILELGCGPGWLSNFLSKMDYQVSGLDISDGMIAIARENAAKQKLDTKFYVKDLEEIDQDQISKNDIVIFYDALHHCLDDEKAMQAAYAYLKPNGILILAEPNAIHTENEGAKTAVDKYGVTERGIIIKNISSYLKSIGFESVMRYHASGQSFSPRSESPKETLKMIIFPLLARFYYGRFKTRVWLVARKKATKNEN